MGIVVLGLQRFRGVTVLVRLGGVVVVLPRLSRGPLSRGGGSLGLLTPLAEQGFLDRGDRLLGGAGVTAGTTALPAILRAAGGAPRRVLLAGRVLSHLGFLEVLNM